MGEGETEVHANRLRKAKQKHVMHICNAIGREFFDDLREVAMM